MPLLSIALVSATALAYEVLLMRLFSIIQWHHFAYMMISLALLGYGVSGAFLMLLQRPLLQRFATSYIINLALFGMHGGRLLSARTTHSLQCRGSALGCPPDRLAAVYLPATRGTVFFRRQCHRAGADSLPCALSRIYAADLLGAGLGSIGIVHCCLRCCRCRR